MISWVALPRSTILARHSVLGYDVSGGLGISGELNQLGDSDSEVAVAVDPWAPTPAISASIFLHVAGFAVLAADPALWSWVAAAIFGNHVILGASGMLPKSQLLGRNLIRLPEQCAHQGQVALTFDDGPDPAVTPRVLDLLDRHGAKASFFCIGRRAAAHPEIVHEIHARGHSVENHSWRHTNAFALLGLDSLRQEVVRTQILIKSITGRSPQFFRAPVGLRNPLLDPVLARSGLRYAGWTRRGFDTVRSEPERILHRLIRGLTAGDLLVLHDRIAAKTSAGQPVVLAVLALLLDRLAARGLRSISLPMAFGQRPNSRTLPEAFRPMQSTYPEAVFGREVRASVQRNNA